MHINNETNSLCVKSRKNCGAAGDFSIATRAEIPRSPKAGTTGEYPLRSPRARSPRTSSKRSLRARRATHTRGRVAPWMKDEARLRRTHPRTRAKGCVRTTIIHHSTLGHRFGPGKSRASERANSPMFKGRSLRPTQSPINDFSETR